MQSKLDAALYWAARGFRVFPVRANSRTPPVLENWTVAATTDPAVIRQWWTDPLTGTVRDYNPAMCTTGMIVVDVDTKSGRRGIETFYRLGLELGDTLTIRTPSGGYHAYYFGPDKALVYDLLEEGSGIDIRAFNSYVLVPGATIDGVPYIVEIEAPIAAAPTSLLALLHEPGERSKSSAPVVDLDTAIAIRTGTQWLEAGAPLAVEGAGGDTTTYEVCCRLRDFGISGETSLILLLEYWNDRCSPPWEPDELKRKIENAWSYARSSPGSAHPMALYSGIKLVPPAYETAIPQEIEFGTLNGVEILPPRPWLMPGFLMRRAVTTLVSTGGVGKSTLLLTLLAHVALGASFLGFKVKTPMRSVLLSAEDDVDENRRRLRAICQHFGFDYSAVAHQLAIISGDLFPMQLTTGQPPTIHKQHAQALVNTCKADDVGVLAIDPLVEFHSAREDDNMQMRYVMGVIRIICREANVAGLVAHHTSKSRGSNSERAGNADISRGAGGIINSSRLSYTMLTADEDDCQRYGIKNDERHLYARLDDAKFNYGLAKTSHPLWLKRCGVKLYNGDEIGVLEAADIKGAAQVNLIEMGRVLLAEMQGKGTASMTISDAARALMQGDPIYATLPLTTVRSRIERWLIHGVGVDGNRVVVIRDASGVRVVIE